MSNDNETCECSDEFGPCEQHGEMLVIREGASQRTADSLLLLLCHDLIDCGAEVSSWGKQLLERADHEEARAMSSYGTSWFCTEEFGGERMYSDLLSLADQLEVDAEVSVTMDDGYTIVRPSADCPLYV